MGAPIEAGGVRVSVEPAYVGVGCNRIVHAAAWGRSNFVAFAAHNFVAICDPNTARIVATLPGHGDRVNCVEWLPRHQNLAEGLTEPIEDVLLSGSADGGLIVWSLAASGKWSRAVHLPSAHARAILCIATCLLPFRSGLVATCSADGTVGLWTVQMPPAAEGQYEAKLQQSLPVGSYCMQAAAMAPLGPWEGSSPEASQPAMLLALGGLDSAVHLYTAASPTSSFVKACVLKGHQDWIRSLDCSALLLPDVSDETNLTSNLESGDNVTNGAKLFVASASQDRNIRIWKLHLQEGGGGEVATEPFRTEPKLDLYSKGAKFRVGGQVWQTSLESLLVGHEDWALSVRWHPPLLAAEAGEGEGGREVGGGLRQPMCLLSASMDRSMMIWRAEKSGLWVNEVSVGELVHTSLGFYGGVWSPLGDAILANGYGGSLHMWRFVATEEEGEFSCEWRPATVPSGHSGAVTDVDWDKTGHFLLSGSHDQTTRVIACWDWKETSSTSAALPPSWHEIARPQVHGHDINCVAFLRGGGPHRCVSGAEEKVARVFEAPSTFLETLAFTCDGKAAVPLGIDGGSPVVEILGANMSALGLSQKPIYATTGSMQQSAVDPVATGPALTDGMEAAAPPPRALSSPPLEEALAQSTLWPEAHKLYGHGNELWAAAPARGGRLLATASKAQAASVADVWLWDTATWHPTAQLRSHTLTVTQMEFSPDDAFLLTVSRDRHLSLWQRQTCHEDGRVPSYSLAVRMEAHKRIVWAASWAPRGKIFATGSRDKTVKVWQVCLNGDGGADVRLCSTLSFRSSVTAVAWSPSTDTHLLAVGMEDGAIEIWQARVDERVVTMMERVEMCTDEGTEYVEDGDAHRDDGEFMLGVSVDGNRRLDVHGSSEQEGRGSSEGRGGGELGKEGEGKRERGEDVGERCERDVTVEMRLVGAVDSFACHVAAVHRLRWRIGPPLEGLCKRENGGEGWEGTRYQLASCSADHSVRLFNVSLLE